MAPIVKLASTWDKDPTAILEGPVSMLWAYQLRREHTFLKTLVDSLADTVRSEDSMAKTKQFMIDLKAQQTRITATETEADSHRLELEGIRTRVSNTDETVAEIQNRLSEHEKHHQTKLGAETDGQKNIPKQIERIKADLQKSFKSALMENREQLRVLQSKTTELEAQIAGMSKEEVQVVRDSIEEVRQLDFDFTKPQLINNRNVSKRINQRLQKDFSHADDLLPEVEEEDSNMLTLDPVQRAEETPATEFDLDAGLATMSYARHLRRNATPEAPMVMLPELPQNNDDQFLNTSLDISQGNGQPWEAYLTDGRRLVDTSLKRKNGVIVDTFVTGILDVHLRSVLERWLDDKVWLWEHVEAFAIKKRAQEQREPSSTAEPTPIIEHIQHEIRKTEKSLALSKDVASLLETQEKSQRMSSELPLVEESQEPVGIRRSQRLARKTVKKTQPPTEVNLKERKTAKIKNAPATMPRIQPKKSAKGLKAAAKAEAPILAQSESIAAEAARPVQAPVLSETTRDRTHGIPNEAKGQAELDHVALPLAVFRAEKPSMELERIKDPSLRAKAWRMRALFSKEILEFCYEALLKTNGNYDDAHKWIMEQTAQPPKPKRQKVVMIPPTPTPINHHVNTLGLSRVEGVDRSPATYKTPQNQVIGRTSHKRKLDLPEQKITTKRARLAKKSKRGPPPMIPILPSSDNE